MNPQPNTPASLNEAVPAAWLHERADELVKRIHARIGTWGEQRKAIIDVVKEAIALAAPGAAIDAREQAVQAAVGSFAIDVEKMLCAKLGRAWSAGGISIASLIDALASRQEAPVASGEPTEAMFDAFAGVYSGLGSMDMEEIIRRILALASPSGAGLGGAVASSEAVERAAFEAWIRQDGGDLSTFGSGKNLHYHNSAVNNAWGGWKIRAALASQPGCAVEGEALSPATVAQPVAVGYFLRSGFDSSGDGTKRWEQVADEYKNDADVVPLYAAQPCASQGCGGAVDRKAEALRWCAAALQAVSPSLHADSLFVMLGTKEEKTLEEVLDLADAALSTAKSGGGATPEGGGE